MDLYNQESDYINDLAKFVYTWIDDKYPNKFKHVIISPVGDPYDSIIRHKDHHEHVIHISEQSIWLFNTGVIGDNIVYAYCKLHASDRELFSKIEECINKYWI